MSVLLSRLRDEARWWSALVFESTSPYGFWCTGCGWLSRRESPHRLHRLAGLRCTGRVERLLQPYTDRMIAGVREDLP